MPFVPAPNVAMVELRYLWDGQKCENTLYFLRNEDLTVSALEAIGGAIADWWATNLKPQTSDDVSLNTVFVTDLTTATSPAVEITGGLPQSGAVAEEALPNNVSLAVKFSTVNRGRSFRGRNYILGIIGSVVAANTVSDAFAAAIVDAYEQLLSAAVIGADFTWVVLSRFADNLPREEAVATPITSVSVTDKTIDSSRRRLPGRGQ
jgi:hypothetical protein